MNVVDLTGEYFDAFSNRDLASLKNMFEDDIMLRDWELSTCGKNETIEAIDKIFKSVDSICILPKLILSDILQTLTISEIEIVVDNSDKLLVVDVIEYSSDSKIKSIRAYKR